MRDDLKAPTLYGRSKDCWFPDQPFGLVGLTRPDGSHPVYKSITLRQEHGIWLADITLEVAPDIEVGAISDSQNEVMVKVKSGSIIARESDCVQIDGEDAPTEGFCLVIKCGPNIVRHGLDRLVPKGA